MYQTRIKPYLFGTINGETEENTKTVVLNENNEEILNNYNVLGAVDNYVSTNQIWFEENVLKIKKDGKIGLIDFEGNEILAPEYEDIYALKGIERSIIIKKDGKVGLFNNVSKDIIIDTKYKSISALGKSYNDGYICIDENNKAGIIGPDKKVLLENKYDDIANISGNGMYIVKNSDVISVIKSDGTVVLDGGFDEIKSIDGQNIIIKLNGSYGVVNTNKENVIETKYEDITYAYGDNYFVKTGGKYGVVNILGETKIEAKYNKIEYRKEAAIFVCDNEDLTSDVYTREFEYKITGFISKIDSEIGYIRVRVKDEIKYYNFKFEEKSNKDILTNNTLFLVKKDGKYGYINKDGEQIVDCIYDDALEQNEYGFCAVKKDGKWGSLKSDGAVVLEPSVELDDSIEIDFIGKMHNIEYFGLVIYTNE